MRKLGLIGVLCTLSVGMLFAQIVPDSLRFTIKDHYAKETMAVVGLLQNYHYRSMELSDSLSEVILNQYLDALDQSRIYFYQSDIEIFKNKYGKQLDNQLYQGDVTAAFAIYKVFDTRFNERMAYVKDHLVNTTFDFSTNETYQTDRSLLPWPSSESEMNDVWRKMVKSQYLNLKLSNKPTEEINKIITERYSRLEKSTHQLRGGDVLQFYLNEVAESFDPHTNYFSPSTSERFLQAMSLSLEGIGASLITENDYTKVAAILPGGPAFKSKLLKANDRIVAVAQGQAEEPFVDVIGWRLDDVVKLIKGPKGTWVRLKVIPAESGINGASVEYSFLREKIKLEDQAATSEILPVIRDGKTYNIGVITVPGFYMDFEAYQQGDPNYNSTTRDVKKFLEEFSSKNVDGVLMDLRDNGGGSLMEAIELTGLFIKNGPVVQVKGNDKSVEVGKDENSQISWDGPLTIMINRFSASASEIFSAAIQDYHRGIIIGEQSYGKGTVQRMIPINQLFPDEKESLGQLKITLQKFYRINGSSTQHKGVMPDIELPSPFEIQKFGESSEPSALPWDQIASTNYKAVNKYSAKLLTDLNTEFKNRLTSDKELMEYISEVNELKSTISSTEISLNEEIRKKELEESEKEMAAKNSLNTEISGNDIQYGKDGIPLNDEFEREGILILTRLIQSKIG